MKALQRALLTEIGIQPYQRIPCTPYAFAGEIIMRDEIFPWIIADVADAAREALLKAILAALKLSDQMINLFKTDLPTGSLQTLTAWQTVLQAYPLQKMIVFGQSAGSLFFKGAVLEKEWGMHQWAHQQVVFGPSLQQLLLYPHLKRQVWHDLTQSFAC